MKLKIGKLYRVKSIYYDSFWLKGQDKREKDICPHSFLLYLRSYHSLDADLTIHEFLGPKGKIVELYRFTKKDDISSFVYEARK